MKDIIFYSGIITFIVLATTVILAYFKKLPRWHRKLGYTVLAIALLHGGMAIYRAIRLYVALDILTKRNRNKLLRPYENESPQVY